MSNEKAPLRFRQLGKLASMVKKTSKDNLYQRLGRDESFHYSASTLYSWEKGYSRISDDNISAEDLCKYMFASGEGEWPENKERFELLKKRIKEKIRNGTLADLGDEATAILEKPYSAKNNNSWMLCLELTKQAVKNTNALFDLEHMNFENLTIQASSGHSTRAQRGSREASRRSHAVLSQIDNELKQYASVIQNSCDSLISEFAISTRIDVSNWPTRPYRVVQSIRQLRRSNSTNAFSETCIFQDLLKARSFRYRSVSILDEDGVLIVKLDDLPRYDDFYTGKTTDYPKPQDWKTSCRITQEQLDNSECSPVQVLWYKAERNGICISLKNWEPHASQNQWDAPYLPAPTDKRDRHDAFFTASLNIDVPPDKNICVEVTCEYEATSISENRFFTELVYQPTIKVEVIGAEDNPSFDFMLHQYSSQSPFWRRIDGRRFVEDLAVEPNTPHLLWWQYFDQWLLLGEGYAIVLEAQKHPGKEL